jgi:hypothetical protein
LLVPLRKVGGQLEFDTHQGSQTPRP